MAWYIRKSVSIGPIRFNLSKSGVGASVGVTGFRIGMRPDGSSYLHAGRHGLYIREELGGKQGSGRSSNQAAIAEPAPTQTFDAVNTRRLNSPERKELIEKLNKSYKSFRFDYLVFVLAALAVGYSWFNSSLFGLIITAGAWGFISIAAAMLEAGRRTVKIFYDFEANDTSSYSKLVQAINNLAECQQLWAYIDSRDLSSDHESKVNAGASSLVSRETAVVGAGAPPWVETNITIPTLKVRGVTAYFMPDCILIYDNNGVGCIEHTSLKFTTGTIRFIESQPVPNDSEIVDHTWRYPNKKGGPDMRFKDNSELPVCLYGELELSTPAGLLCRLQTSDKDAPRSFSKQYSAYLRTLR